MSWSGTYTFKLALGVDFLAATVFFGHFGITISTMAGLVRDGKDGPLKLWGWQRRFLRWLEPRLSRAHCEGARLADIERCRVALRLMGERAS